jgi:hypothetical protein|tara:strand:- start:1781 stop:1960 length:180 start_codon:yes stop_codon:yes gene_type:complete
MSALLLFHHARTLLWHHKITFLSATEWCCMIGFHKSQLTRLQEFYNLLPTYRRKRLNLV